MQFFLDQQTDRLVAGKCVADGSRVAGGAPVAGGHLAGVQEPKQEARRIVSVSSFSNYILGVGVSC